MSCRSLVPGLLLAATASSLWACTTVDGDRIRGADLAIENVVFADLDPAADLGPAPLAGSQRVLRTNELQRLAERYGVTLGESAPGTACFERAAQRLSRAILTPVLEAALTGSEQLRDADLKIVDYNRHAIPLGELEFRISDLAPSGLWRGRLVYAENRSVPVWARVRVTDPATGEPIVAWREPSVPDVKPGDTVEVEVRSGAVLLAFEASAQGTAHAGETVLVRNPENGKRFRAVVKGPGRVEVTQ